MVTAEQYRTQAGALYQLSKENSDRIAAFAQILEAIDCETKAEELERGQVPPDKDGEP
jgi:hypothetical protein